VKLAVVTTHPIQYHAAWFRSMARCADIDLEVFYCHRATPSEQAAAGFGVEFDWDVSLTEGYLHRFLKNVAERPSVGLFRGLDTPEINEILATEDFDAVMINGWHYKSAWQTMRACWKSNTPVMVRSDSQLQTERSGLRKAAKWPFYRWFIPRLDACLAVGQRSTDYFRHYGADVAKILLVPHVIDVDFFRSESEKAKPLRTALLGNWGIAPNSRVFLFAGKFIPKKRPMDFVLALKAAVESGAEVAGLMVGDGPLRAACEEFVTTNNLPIRFTGFLNQSEISAAYAAGDFLILPSDGGETWGLVVNEAMACGCPCLVSESVGSAPDMIIEGETGYTFPQGEIRKLGALIKFLANGSNELERLKANAIQKASEYSVERGVDAMLQAAERVIAARS
jgi:glycosyltransferase involved in cell wall biosynthesis